MATQVDVYHPPDSAGALRLSQKAPVVLARSSLLPKSLPFSAISSNESPEEWAELEQIFYATLRTGDDEAAHRCLERLSARFGNENYRIMALRGLYQEATARTEEDIRRILQGYNKILDADPMNVPIRKRRISLIRSVDRHADAISLLVNFLEIFPTDSEAWCELSDMYYSQGLLPQAIFCIEEALLPVPNAWNLHARLGELNYIAGSSTQEGTAIILKYLTESVKRFARSVELCQDYLRGYYGLKVTTSKILETPVNKEVLEISKENIQELNTKATNKLRSIIKEYPSQAYGSREPEIIAAQALLDRD